MNPRLRLARWWRAVSGRPRTARAGASRIREASGQICPPGETLDFASIIAGANANDAPRVFQGLSRLGLAALDDCGGLRALLNPLGRAGLSWFQVRVWATLVALEPHDAESVSRALRIAVSAIEEDSVYYRADSDAATTLNNLLEVALDFENRPGAWAIPILQIGCAANPAARNQLTKRTLQAVGADLTANAVVNLHYSWPPFRLRWLSAVYAEFRRIARFQDAEILMAAMVEANPGNGRYIYRLLETKLRRGASWEVAALLCSELAAGLTVQELKLLYTRLGEHVSLLRLPSSAPLTQAMRVHLALIGLVAPVELKRAVVARLSQEDRRALAIAYLQVENDDARLCPAIRWDSVARQINDLEAGLGDDLSAWSMARSGPLGASDAAVAIDAALTADGPLKASDRRSVDQAIALRGLFLVDDLVALLPPLRSPQAETLLERTGALISFAPTTPGFQRDWGAAFSDWHQIRAGSLSAGEREEGDTQSLTDVGFGVNSDDDYASARLAGGLSRRVVLHLLGRKAQPGTFGDEVVRLTAEDRLFPGVIQAMRLLRYLQAGKFRTVVLIATDTTYLDALATAAFLRLQGIAHVGVVFSLEDPLQRAKLISTWNKPVASLPALAFAAALAELPLVPARVLDLERLWPATTPRPPARKAADGRRKILLTTSLGDSSYFISTVALHRQLSQDFDLTIYNGAHRGAERFRALNGILDERLRERPPVPPETLSILVGPSRRVLKKFDANWTGDEVDLFAVAVAPRLSKTIPPGLANEFNQAALLREFVDAGDVDLVLAIPGRMICSRALILAARSCGIPTLDLQAFFISPHPRYHPGIADVYCGITEDQLDVYRAKSPPKWQRLERIGSLMIGEQLSRVKDLSIAQARADFGVPGGQRMIVFGAQHGQGQEGEEIIRMIVRAANTVENSLLIVKLHPRTSIDAVEGLRQMVAAEAKGEVRVQREGDIYALMRAADLVVTQFSNVGLEAAVMGRPVLSINLTGDDYVVDLARMGVADRAGDAQEVIDKVHSLLDDPAAREALRLRRDAYFERNPELRDLTASTKVEALVREMLETPSRGSAPAKAAGDAPVRRKPKARRVASIRSD